MKNRNDILKFLLALNLLFWFFGAFLLESGAITINHHAPESLSEVPDSVIENVKENLHIFYGCTSHGYQIISGMDILMAENSLYSFNNGEESLSLRQVSTDLGHNGDTAWAAYTRGILDEPGNDINIVVWSWCGGVSDNTEEGINLYLAKMNELESDYPDVYFVYMTGHLDGTGPDGNLYIRNDQIRLYCALNNKILYDFADIESFDPDGNYFPDETDYCNWCYDWCAIHACPACSYCPHTHCFNCYRKARAFWVMLAQIDGWSMEAPACGDVNSDGSVDISDAVGIITFVFIGGTPPDPMDIGDANCDESVDISDAVYLVNIVFLGGNPPCDINGDGEPDCGGS